MLPMQARYRLRSDNDADFFGPIRSDSETQK
jgi:hypothetical protein